MILVQLDLLVGLEVGLVWLFKVGHTCSAQLRVHAILALWKINMQQTRVKKSFAFLAVGFLVLAAFFFFDQLYKQALLNVVVAILFGVAYIRK